MFQGLFSNFPLQKKSKEEFLYQQGDSPKGVYWIQEGLLAITQYSTKAQEHILRVYGGGNLVGHRSLLAKEAYHANCRCISDSQVFFVPAPQFEAMLEENKLLANSLIKSLAKDLGRAETRGTINSDANVTQRVASALIYLKSIDPKRHWTRSEIASYCASRTETVIRSIKDLESRGFIQLKGRQIELIRFSELLEMQN